jgi:hypothetical protein
MYKDFKVLQTENNNHYKIREEYLKKENDISKSFQLYFTSDTPRII